MLPYIPQEYRVSRGLMYQETEELQHIGHSITFHLIPGHSGLIGNEKPDLLARKRAEKGGKLAERWSSLACIWKNNTEARTRDLTKWDEGENTG